MKSAFSEGGHIDNYPQIHASTWPVAHELAHETGSAPCVLLQIGVHGRWVAARLGNEINPPPQLFSETVTKCA
jgi:hypothetical protein